MKLLPLLLVLLIALVCTKKHHNQGMNFLLGQTLTNGQVLKTVTINYKYGSFLGMGGDQTATYQLARYNLGKGQVNVFIETPAYSFKPTLTITKDY
jgi:hypothetical protein